LLPFCVAIDISVLQEVEALTEPAVFNMVRFVAVAPFLPSVIHAFGDELGVLISLAYLALPIGLIKSFFTAFMVCLLAHFFNVKIWIY
jgi:hypothetical protein